MPEIIGTIVIYSVVLFFVAKKKPDLLLKLIDLAK